MAKAVCGRFPAVEQRMHEWMDRQIASGVEVRDSTARDQAKEFAKEAGFPTDRFKASAKWLDKVRHEIFSATCDSRGSQCMAG